MSQEVQESNFKVGAYPFFKDLRKTEPVYPLSKEDGNTTWIVTQYEDVLSLLKKPSFIKDQSKLFSQQEEDETPLEVKVFQNMMLDVDPPDHRRLRKLVQPHFNPKTIRKLEPRILDIADDLINEMRKKDGPVDLIDDFAFPLPIIVISELLGVPVEDRDKFRQWSNTIVSAADNTQEDFAADINDFIHYLDILFEERQADPREDLISKLLQTREEGDLLSNDELYSMIVLLIIAGHETTVNLIGNGMLALFEHPEELDKLINDLSLTETAVEECLRYYSPVDFSTARWAEEELTLRGRTIKRGDLVLASLSSANRDEKKFDNPDEFDITRKPNSHIAFGYGIHFCLGAPLARLEGKIAFQKLLTAFPHIKLAEKRPEWRNMFLLRGLKQLLIKLNTESVTN
ncbi:cytochrome P450 [Halobacillus salinarum]|uniref:Cytochrome P450 n=1 Tax=Halobacillus salinarum TaxID=2932257 RepID=A0ABY4EFM7_9BACI|nr:cytochrome P450 [Halobacillus salinarum]UOQ43281.1 cytochrome P450 [Halobacillus salinarum]